MCVIPFAKCETRIRHHHHIPLASITIIMVVVVLVIYDEHADCSVRLSIEPADLVMVCEEFTWAPRQVCCAFHLAAAGERFMWNRNLYYTTLLALHYKIYSVNACRKRHVCFYFPRIITILFMVTRTEKYTSGEGKRSHFGDKTDCSHLRTIHCWMRRRRRLPVWLLRYSLIR